MDYFNKFPIVKYAELFAESLTPCGKSTFTEYGLP